MEVITLTGGHFLLFLGLAFAAGFLLGAIYEGSYYDGEDKELPYSDNFKARHGDKKKGD